MDKRKLPQVLLIAAAVGFSIGAVIQFIRSEFLIGSLNLVAALLAVGFLIYMRKAPTL
ncbi:hypothetical protein ARGLB_029_00060 [Arthrobacter globiformis NBRC 12137]|uniref:Uncharacterized protein n=1 Tax=Arthrobacter globiformis (strain ATCC 8010 / DSM 20124 / JCM 1332 / NBRC 12137 / NCIMB 8907 / NRRL B-2979 / 168) TaxID=1077972 RepID=H0QJC9_ARTG1|nr:hypothetical protein [Arthrobacter globiformis]GAB12930.1 hypothetical protein ARGLB_029_00060 [Arthrobacter globiformis NBRC 12137]